MTGRWLILVFWYFLYLLQHTARQKSFYISSHIYIHYKTVGNQHSIPVWLVSKCNTILCLFSINIKHEHCMLVCLCNSCLNMLTLSPLSFFSITFIIRVCFISTLRFCMVERVNYVPDCFSSTFKRKHF